MRHLEEASDTPTDPGEEDTIMIQCINYIKSYIYFHNTEYYVKLQHHTSGLNREMKKTYK